MIQARALFGELRVEGAREELTVRRWGNATTVLLLGYLLFSRAFAHLGMTSPPVYVGDLFLAAFFLLRADASGRLWFASLLRRNDLSALAWALYVSLAYGVVLTLRGILGDQSTLQSLQNLVFNVYPLYVFLGLWLGQRDPSYLRRFVLLLAWANAIYAILYVGFLNGLYVTVPGPSVFLFNNPQGQMFAILGLIAFHRTLRKTWFPLTVNTLMLIGIQTRAHWAGILFAIPVWVFLSRRLGRFVAVMSVLTALMFVAFVLDLRVPSVLSRGPTTISARNVVGAAIAPFDEQTAAQYNEQARKFAGTTAWRLDWWTDIWGSVHETTPRMLVGFGYGYYLKSTSDIRTGKDDLRTPHNVFFYALGFGGWIGVSIFAALLLAVGRLLWVAYRRTGQAFGLAALFLGFGVGLFTNYFETPFAAIPYWTILGLAAAPAFLPEPLEWDEGDALPVVPHRIPPLAGA